MKDLLSTRFVLERNRFAWIDYARGMCIILVVYRHCFEGLTSAGLETAKYTFFKLVNVSLFSFRMPLFFMMSGVFVSQTLLKKTFNRYVNDRFKTILYPMLIWGSIQITLQLMFSQYVNADREVIDYVNLVVRPRKIEQFWYLNALFMVGVVYAFFKSVLRMNMWQLMISGMLCYSFAAVFFVIYDQRTTDHLEFFAYTFVPDFLHFYIYFFIGDALSQFILKKENHVHFSSFLVMLPVFVVFVVTHYFFTVINLENNADTYVEHFRPVLYLVVSLTGCAFMIQLSFVFQRLNILKILRVIGYHSLHIYVSHLIVISTLRTICVHFLDFRHVPSLIILSVITGIIIPVVLYNILVRNGFWWLYTLKKPEDEIKYYHTRLALGH